MLERMQRTMALRVTGAWQELCQLNYWWKRECICTRRRLGTQLRVGGEPEEIVGEVAEDMGGDNYDGSVDEAVDPEGRIWINCPFREGDYFLTQFLTGHGSFRTYTKRIGKETEDSYIYCREVDTPLHTVLVCESWHRNRRDAETELGVQITVNSIMATMLRSKETWRVITNMIRRIMNSKEEEERHYQQQNRRDRTPNRRQRRRWEVGDSDEDISE